MQLDVGNDLILAHAIRTQENTEYNRLLLNEHA